MDSAPVFAPFCVAHLIVIALTITLPLVFAAMAHGKRSAALKRVFSAASAALLAVNYVGTCVFRLSQARGT